MVSNTPGGTLFMVDGVRSAWVIRKCAACLIMSAGGTTRGVQDPNSMWLTKLSFRVETSYFCTESEQSKGGRDSSFEFHDASSLLTAVIIYQLNNCWLLLLNKSLLVGKDRH